MRGEAGLDRITKDFIQKFMLAYELETDNERKDFERFSVYCAVKQDYSAHFDGEDLENICVGNNQDTGLDGVAIIVENQFVENVEDIKSVVGQKDSVQIAFVFVQSTISKKFDSKKFREFTIGVQEFFYDYAKPDRRKTKKRNSKIEDKVLVASKLLEETSTMIERPICKLYYFMGNDVEAKLGINTQLVLSERESLLELNIFDRVEIEVKGTSYLHKLYRKTLAKPKAQIFFDRRVTLPQIDGINASYMGIVPFAEFKKLIIDENSGNIRNVFEDNVRYFNEKYPRNQKIKETIEKGDIDKFILLNNGITIVTKKLSVSADKFTLEDYQIVNGCQTSNIIYQCRNSFNIEKVYVSLKIIHTDDQAIANDITIATNNQTEVNIEALNSLTKFHRDLEIYYSSRCYKVDKNEIYLYYERQEGKYEQDTSVESKQRIISVKNQAKYFAAMFLDVPHESYAFKARLMKKIEKEIFKDGHPFEPYYTSAVVHYELYKFLRNVRNGKDSMGVYRFHILMVVKYLIIKSEVPIENYEKLKQSCEKIISIVESKNRFMNIIKQAVEITEEAIKEHPDADGANKVANLNKVANFVSILKTKAINRASQIIY